MDDKACVYKRSHNFKPLLYKNKQQGVLLTSSICKEEVSIETLQNWATLSDRLAPRNVLNGVDKKRINPYNKLFLKHSCLMPGHTQSPLFT